MRRSLPSLPLPAHSTPSALACSVHRNGAEVSATTDADGPSSIRPSLSIERSCTSPSRKSAWVPTVQKVGVAADTTTHKVLATARAAAAARKLSMSELSRELSRIDVSGRCLAGSRRRWSACDCPIPPSTSGSRIHRPRCGAQRLAVDDRARSAGQEADVDAIVPPRVVQDANHLLDALWLQRPPHLALLDGIQLLAVGDEHR